MPHLRFFTDENYQSRTAHRLYETYWREVRAQMPPELFRLNGGMLPDELFDDDVDPIHLHDARIRHFEKDHSTLRMVLHGDNKGALRETHLCYSGVTACSGFSDQMLSDTPESDLMCHETTIIPTGGFRHTMYFASDELLSIDFVSISLDVVDHPPPPWRP